MHNWTKNLIYTTQDEGNPGRRGLLWSSSFIQAYYTCETLGAIDWQSTLRDSRLEAWAKDAVESINPPKAIKAMLHFCYDLLGPEAPRRFDDLFKEELKGLDNPVAILMDIPTDTYYFQEQQNFRQRYEQIMNCNSLSPDEHLDLVFRMARFVYSVRENLFHGYTLAVMVSENLSLQKRLLIYTGLLIAICELLFITLEQKTNWHPEITRFDRSQYDYYLEALAASKLRHKGRINILQHLHDRKNETTPD
jgi:hypothetical protein